ncbi:hypothetical protein CEK62_19610 [Alcanivorax sp. N3-2A]|nr:hypothetical protein CEK62_19610 [Alcanivorax sp. N3-2A]
MLGICFSVRLINISMSIAFTAFVSFIVIEHQRLYIIETHLIKITGQYAVNDVTAMRAQHGF